MPAASDATRPSRNNAVTEQRPTDARHGAALSLTLIVAGAAAWIACFIASLSIFSALSEGTPEPAGILGLPWPTAGLVLLTLPIGAGVAMMAVRRASETARPHPVVGGFALIAGAVGLLAAWSLTADKVVTLISPGASLGCNYSLLVQCGANLSSQQGSVFGFPNPLIGLAGWAAVLVMGAALLLRAPVAGWFRALFAAGVTGAMALVVWLITQSIFVLGTLCPWCLVTWSVTIPLFWVTWGYTLSHTRAARLGATLLNWSPLLTIVSYSIVAVLAQLRLDFLAMI